ncbi:MAG: nucleotidyl transferase AbiEii/AbiGii toxin family protein [Candidatus Auribacterota bacterium]|nr:nucleotidyl transferase AbiEii/AbiGii toxin family protein [Candidatus Auribacterota bacterium]
MPDPRIYANQEAFRQALGERLKQRSQEHGIDLNRLYKQVAFERLLARLFSDDPPRWLLKGGYAIELWLGDAARATKDIDLTIPHLTFISDKDADNLVIIRELLQEKAAQDLGDYFQFLIGEKILELHDAPAGGARFPVEARVSGRTFTKFHLDIGIGDEVIGNPEWRTGHELLSFAGIPPARIALIPIEQQFAEKIHALTKPRGEIPNSRVKDLADLVLLIEYGLPEARVVVRAIRATFDRRDTHTIPKDLKIPPREWEPVYNNFVRDFNLPASTINEALERVTTYWKTLFKD